MSTTNFQQLITYLSEAEVQYVLIGGLAAIAHGSAYVTYDVDVCYERSSVLSLEALIRAKQAAGRRKDLLIIPELEALLALRNRPLP